MKHSLLIIALLMTCLVAGAQENRFIKIVGNSSMTVESSEMKINIVLTEIARDEYNKVRERSIDEIKLELEGYLKPMGYAVKDLEEIWPPRNNYNKTVSFSYNLNINSLKDAKEIFKFNIKGFKAQNFEYLYPSKISYDDENLSKEAMKDAKRKAEALAKYVGKKVGDIINIEDKSNSTVKLNGNKKNASTSFNYNLIVTYELLD